MDYDLTKPCAKCPFRTDCLKGWLGRARAAEIVHSNGEFACHETTENDGEGERVETEKSKHCAGFLILLEKIEQPNQMMRICERLGMYDRSKLKMGQQYTWHTSRNRVGWEPDRQSGTSTALAAGLRPAPRLLRLFLLVLGFPAVDFRLRRLNDLAEKLREGVGRRVWSRFFLFHGGSLLEDRYDWNGTGYN